MKKKGILYQLNIFDQCRESGVPLWQCPQFLFVIMGMVIIITVIGSYLIGSRYVVDPSIIALIDIGVSGVLLIISFIIIQSFERLAEASRMKSEFIGIVSHQLRSPITNIKWILDFLTSEDVEMSKQKEEEYFKHLKENTGRMVELVDELLIVSRIENGSFPIKKKMSSLERIIEELVSRSKPFAEASNIKLSFAPQENLPMIMFDPALIKLVTENLVDNAIRYTEKGGTVEINLKKEKNDLHFLVKDSGVGIPKTEQPYIFGKFFRAENKLKEKTKGSGLGLYIAKLIIDASEGKIWFKSTEGEGTIFHFTLPIN